MEKDTDLVFIETSLVQGSEQNDLRLYEIAQSVSAYVEAELSEISTYDEAKELHARTNGISSYIRKAIKDRRLKLKAANDLTWSLGEINCWIGGWLAENHTENRVNRSTNRTYLHDLGLSKNDSSNSKAMSFVPKSERKAYFEKCQESEKQYTLGYIINWGQRIKKAQSAKSAKAEAKNNEKTLPPTHHTDCLYHDDYTSIWHGDAGNLSFIASDTIDLIITSPPYNIGTKAGNGRVLWRGVEYSTHDDVMPEPDYQDWQVDVLSELWRVARPGASLFYNHKVRNRKGRGIHPLEWVLKSEWVFRQQIIWDRVSTHNKEMSYFWPHDELILWLTKGTKGVYLSNEGARMSTIWKDIGFETNSNHPAPFPRIIPSRCIRAASKPGDLILDPFGGSMTTCRAAKQLNRKSIGVDISRDYVIKYSVYLTQGVLL